MMKKIFLFSFLAFAVAFQVEAQLKKAAVISVFGDKNLSDDPLDTKLYEAIMKDSSFNITKIVYKFDETLQTNFLKEFPFPFMPKEEVVNAPGYKELSDLSRFKEGNFYITPGEGYVGIAAFGALMQDDKAIKKSFELLPQDVEGVMVAYINFNMYEAGGIGPYAKQKVRANVNLKIFNREGKRIFKLKEAESSNGGVSSLGGIVLDIKKVMPLIEEASDNLFVAMQKKLNKKLKSMAKKIDKDSEDKG